MYLILSSQFYSSICISFFFPIFPLMSLSSHSLSFPLPPSFILFILSPSSLPLFNLSSIFHLLSPILYPFSLALVPFHEHGVFQITNHTKLFCATLPYVLINFTLFHSIQLNYFLLLLFSNLPHRHLINCHPAASPFYISPWCRAYGRSGISLLIRPYLRHFQPIQPISRDEP